MEVRTALGLVLLFGGLYLLTHNGHLGGGPDEELPFAMTQNLVERGTLSTEAWPEAGLWGRSGRFYPAFGIGQSLLAVPFYLLGRGVVAGLGLRPEEGRAILVYFTTWLNPWLTALTCGLLFLWLRHLGFGRRVAGLSVVFYGLGTLAWPYAKTFLSEPAQALSLLAAAGLLACRGEGWDSSRHKWSRVWGAGGLYGLSLLVRPFHIIALPAFLVYLGIAGCGARKGGASSWGKGRWEAFGPFLAFLLPVALTVAWLLGYNWYRFGDWREFGYGPHATYAFRPARLGEGLYGLFLSPGKGLVFYSPIVLLALAGWGPFRRRRPAEAAFIASLWFVEVLFFAARSWWWGNWCWGPRYLVPLLPFAFPLVAAAWEAFPTRALRLTAAGLMTLSLLAQGLGLLVYNGLYIDLATRQVPMRALLFDPYWSPLVGHFELAWRGYIDNWLWMAWKTGERALAGLMSLLYLTLSVWGWRWAKEAFGGGFPCC